MSPLAPNNVMIIGLGGTGKHILTHLKQSLIHAANHAIAANSTQRSLTEGYGNTLPEGIRLLCLDTDHYEVSVEGISLDYNDINDFVWLGGDFLDIKSLRNALIHNSYATCLTVQDDRFPWFESDDAQRLSVGFSDYAYLETLKCSQRQFSRLCLMQSEYSNRNLYNKVSETITYFQSLPNIVPVTGSTRRNYFFVVGSLAGGTGSGMFEDVITLLNQCIEDTPGMVRPSVVGISVLSNAFNFIPWDETHMKANCIAAIRELQRFVVMRNQPYPNREYQAFAVNPLHGLPCDALFVIDGTRPSTGTGTALTSKDLNLTLFPAVADYLQAFCLNEAMPFDRIDTYPYLNGSVENLFSTFGCHTWMLPVEDIIDSFSVRLACKYVDHLLEPALPNYDCKAEVVAFLNEPHNYYCQDVPHGEYVRGVTPAGSRFLFLSRFQELVSVFENSNAAPPMDLDWFRSFFHPDQFPTRHVTDVGPFNPVEQNRLPLLDDVSGCDEFRMLDGLRDLRDARRVIDTVNEIRAANIGTVDCQDGDQQKTHTSGFFANERTWHGVMQYYRKLCSEIFAGYDDPQGMYRPGILENKIFLILNKVKHRSEQADVTGSADIGGKIYQRDDLSYSVAPQSLGRALSFCMTLECLLKLARKIIEDQYDATFKIGGKFQYDINCEEATRREKEYLDAGISTRWSKKKSYLQSMQDLLESERIEIIKRSTISIIDGFIAITRGWQETLEKCRETFDKRYQSELVVKANSISAMRQSHAAIATRTYLVPEYSDQEKDVYTKVLETRTGTALAADGQHQVAVTNTTSFIDSSYLEIVPNTTDVDSRPGYRRTGREIRPLFKTAGVETWVVRPEDIIRNASFWCQGVRDIDFWDTLLADPRYPQGPNGYPGQLAGELRKNTAEFIQYETDGRNNRYIFPLNWVSALYADTSQKTVDVRELTNVGEFQIGRGGVCNHFFGQQYRIVSISQVHGLSLSDLPEYGSQQNFKVYRSFLKQVSSAPASIGTPLHIHLGEKYAARYEAMIISRWQELRLISQPPADFTLSSEAIYALQALKNLKNLFWAGTYLKIIILEGTPDGVDTYYLTTPGGLKPELGRGIPVPLHDLIFKYIHGDGRHGHPIIPDARTEIETVVNQAMAKAKNSNRSQYNEDMRQILDGPLDRFIVATGKDGNSFVGLLGNNRTNDPMTMDSLEKLDLLFKCFVLEELI